MTVLEALRAEVESSGALFDSLTPNDWTKPTRLTPMTVHDLAVHIKRGAIRVIEMIEGGSVMKEPEVDGETYWWRPRERAAQEGAEIVARAQADAAQIPADKLAGAWKRDWGRAFALAANVIEADEVFQSPFGLIRLSEYLRTRHIEVVIHHMDLCHAIGSEPNSQPEALDIVCGVLAGLLGTDPRRFGMDAVRFALIGTGRAALIEDERAALGPLADEFPLIW